MQSDRGALFIEHFRGVTIRQLLPAPPHFYICLSYPIKN